MVRPRARSLEDMPSTASHEDAPAAPDTTVLVVGAGPTGLMAALTLTAAGVPVRIVDPKSGPTRESRALGVQARTVEVYDQFGLAERMLAQAQSATTFAISEAGSTPARPIPIADLQHGETPFPGIHVFEQSRNEELLADALTAAGGCVEWGTRLVALTTDHAGVEAVLQDSAGNLSRCHARWCVGADGAGSLVRRSVDIPFTGVTDEGRFWVADVDGVTALPRDGIRLQFDEEGLLLAFPMSADGDHQRLLGMVRGDGDPRADDVLADVARRFGVEHRTVRWFSHYRVHHRVADAFRAGPVFLAGDAAHVHSPVGGQGMNTGLQDAHNLALKMADVHHGRGHAALLERYEAERRPVARILVSATDRAFGQVSGTSARSRLLRRVVVPRVGFPLVRRLAGTPIGGRAGGYLGQYRIHYPSADERSGPVGRRLRPTSDNRAALRDRAWQLHHYGPQAPSRPDGLPDWLLGVRSFPSMPGLSPDRLYLIRPDGFVAAQCAPASEPVIAALRAADLRTG